MSVSLIKIQTVSTIVTVTLGLMLVPRFGIVGAATAVAVTTVFTNICYVVQVRKVLGFFPHGRHSLRLILPTLVSAAVVLCLHLLFHGVRPSWLAIVMGLTLGYVTFLGVSLLSGIDADDRLIGRAVWSKMKGILPCQAWGSHDGPVREVHLPEELCQKAEHRFAARFGGVDDLLTFVLTELVRVTH